MKACPRCLRKCATFINDATLGLVCGRCAGVKGRPARCERCDSKAKGIRLVLGSWQCADCQSGRGARP